MTRTAAPGLSVEVKLVTLGALAFSALTGTLVTGGRARVAAAAGGAVMVAGAAYSLFSEPKRTRS